MELPAEIKCLFVDIGGVLLTNGWDLPARKRAAAAFRLDPAEMEERHHLTFDTYEEGKLTLEEYLGRVIFHCKRSFSRLEFQRFMFQQSQPFPQMIQLIRALKEAHGLKVVVVSNEARELNAHRIFTFQLDTFVDAFVSSCYVHIRKPDADIFRLALDLVQISPERIVFIENTPMFVQVAEGLGIRGILHRDYASTRARLAALGLPLPGTFEPKD